MHTKKPIAIGMDDFKKIITDNAYYVDKTDLIARVIDDKSLIKLITRPRRFGKTLNLSTLKYFFDSAQQDENRPLFDGLAIQTANSGSYMAQQGKYPVIFLTLKDINENNFKDFEAAMAQKTSRMFNECLFLLDSPNLNKYELAEFESNLTGKFTRLESSLLYFSELLSKHYRQQAVILIDEYDSPIINAYAKTPADKINAPKSELTFLNLTVNFFRNFLGAALKTNPYLHTAVLTGITRVSRESIFSDLNNINVYSVLSEYYKNCFGFTEPETFALLDYYGFDYDKEVIRAYYDGYNFGKFPEEKSNLYNPWSITKLAKETLQNGRNRPLPEPYWVNTSQDILIQSAVKNDVVSFANAATILLEGGSIERRINEHVVLSDIHGIESAWGLLLSSGYLTVDGWNLDSKKYSLCIPNGEIKTYFEQVLERVFLQGYEQAQNMLELLFEDLETFKLVLNERIKDSVSFRNLNNEKDYQNLLLGILLSGLHKPYTVRAERESGLGYYDILASDGSKTFIFELKHVKDCTQQKIEAGLAEAAAQTRKRNYGEDIQGEVVRLPVVTGDKHYWFGQQVEGLT